MLPFAIFEANSFEGLMKKKQQYKTQDTWIQTQ